MKKFLIPLILLAFFVITAFGIEYVFEDNWICEQGRWINLGGPFSQEPQDPCIDVAEAEEQNLGSDEDEHGCIGSAGYTWCEEKQKCLRTWEEPCTQEEIFNLLFELKQETEVEFSGIANTNFEWKTSTDSGQREYEVMDVDGKKISAVRVQDADLKNVDDFFIDQYFQRDVYNISAGSVSSSTGFIKQATVCLVNDVWSGYDSRSTTTPQETEFIDIEVLCGEL